MKIIKPYLQNASINDYLYWVCIISLPFNNILVVLSFILFLVVGFFFNKNISDRSFLSLALSSMFILGLLSLFYTHHVEESLHKISKNLAFLLVPFAFYFNSISNKAIKVGFVLLSLSWVLFCAFSLLKLLYSWIYLPDQRNYYNFIQASMHHNYMPQDAMYICTAFIFLLFNNRYSNYFKFFVSVLYLFILVLFGVRLGMLQFFIIALVYIISERKKFFRLKNVLLGCLLLFLCVVAVHSNPYTKDKMYSTLHAFSIKIGQDKVTEISEDYHKINFRQKLWTETVHVIKESPLLGHGAGTEKEILWHFTKSKNLNIGKVHAHNQFLSITFQYGFFGLFVFIALLFFLFYKALPIKQYILVFFIMITSMLTDSYFDIQHGIFYFSIFSSIILNHKKK